MEFKGQMALVGGGNMGSALLKGILESKTADKNQIVVVEKDLEKANALESDLGIKTISSTEMAKNLDVAIMAVKPYDIPKALQGLSKTLKPGGLVLSIAAGVTLKTLSENLSDNAFVIRVMPNTPALIGMGASAMAPKENVPQNLIELGKSLFEAVGKVVLVEEKHMDAVTGLSGSGPAYIFLIIEAMADAGVHQGLPRDKALDLACQTVIGSALLLQKSNKHPAELKDMVTSPQGTTISGLHVLETGGLRGLIMNAVAKATERSKELGA